MAEANIKKLPLKNILVSSLRYCLDDRKKSLFFTCIAYVLGILALLSWKSLLFWPVLFLMYVAWGTFFRYYFNKKPYINWHSLLNSMVPSTKIVVLAVVIGTILIVLPFFLICVIVLLVQNHLFHKLFQNLLLLHYFFVLLLLHQLVY